MIPKTQVLRCVTGFMIILLGSFSGSAVLADDTTELSGVVYYNHDPISDYTDVTPSLWIYDITDSQVYNDAVLTYDGDTGSYTLSNLPVHSFSISMYFFVTGSSASLPGNFHADGFPNLTQLTEEQRNHFELIAQYKIHMTSPWDNSLIEFPTDTYLEHPCHIEFHWDAVNGADCYSLNITRTRDSEHSSGYGYIETILDVTTSETSYSVYLEDSAEFEHYESDIRAYNAQDEEIAYYMTVLTNGSSWDYRFKTQSDALILKKMTLKAGKTDGSDSFVISGWFDAVEQIDFVNGDTITIQLGDLAPWTITDPLKQMGNKPKYSWTGTPGVTPSVKLDLDKATFSITGKNMDIDGLAAPVFVSLAFGDYSGWCEAQDEGGDDIVNGSKPLPIQFLVGLEDAIVVQKVTCKENTQTQTVKLLNASGGIATLNNPDLTQVAGVIHWGTQSYPIPFEGLADKGNGKYVYVKKATQADPSSANIAIDLNKCTFKITLKNTDMTWEDSPSTLGIELGVFDEEDDAEF